MKHKSLFILAATLLIPLTSCFTLQKSEKEDVGGGIGGGLGALKSITTSKDLFDFDNNVNCVLQNDITLIPGKGFLTWGDVNVKSATLDGQGHTLTVKGDKGTLRNIDKTGYSLWYSMNNCTVKNLNIVFDYAFEYVGSYEPRIAGFVSSAESCIFDNVHITYKRGHKVDNSAYCEGNLTNPCFAGGFAAKMWNSHMNNCSVTGSLNYSTYCSGGLVGFFSDSVMSYCKFDGELIHRNTGYLWSKRDDTYMSYTGALCGVVRPGSKVYGCEVNMQSITLNRKDNGWRSETFENGIAFGRIMGKVQDIKIIFKENPVINFTPTTNYDVHYVGVLAGGATSQASIKNIMIDFSKAGDAFKKKQIKTIDSLIDNNGCSNIEKVYTVGDLYHEGKKLKYVMNSPWEKDISKKFTNLDKYYGITSDFTYLSIGTNYGYDNAPLHVDHMELVKENRLGDRLIIYEDMIEKERKDNKVIYWGEDMERSISCHYTFYWRVEFEPLTEDFMEANIGIYGVNGVFHINKYMKFVDDQTTISFAGRDFLFETPTNRWVVKDGENNIDFENQFFEPHQFFEPELY